MSEWVRLRTSDMCVQYVRTAVVNAERVLSEGISIRDNEQAVSE